MNQSVNGSIRSGRESKKGDLSVLSSTSKQQINPEGKVLNDKPPTKLQEDIDEEEDSAIVEKENPESL